jgi:hypothetical protein
MFIKILSRDLTEEKKKWINWYNYAKRNIFPNPV